MNNNIPQRHSTLKDLFYRASENFAHGELQQAEIDCRAVLERRQSHPDAWHLLGLIAADTGHPQEAVECIQKAIYYAPRVADYHNSLGLILGRMGDISNAIHAIKTALEIKNDYPEGWFNLANLYRQNDEIEHAISAYQKVLAYQADHFSALNNLANLYRGKGDISAAINMLNKVLSINGEFAPAHYNLGLIHKNSGYYQLAEKSFKRAVRYKLDFIIAWYQLGLTQIKLQQFDRAINSIQLVTDKSPDHPDAWFYLGHAQNESGKLQDALLSFQKMLQINPKHAETHNNLGIIYKKIGEMQKAENCFKSALEYSPDYPDALNNLAELYQARGNFSKAGKLLNKLLALKSYDPVVWKNYANHRHFSVDELEKFDVAEALLTDKTIKDEDQAMLHFALGKVYDDSGEYAQAFRHFQEGNFIRKKHHHYDAEYYEQLINDIIKFFDADYFGQSIISGSNSNLPVFIIGMPRSGTSLVEQIIASHSQVHGAGELSFFNALVQNSNQFIASDYPWPYCLSHLQQKDADEIKNAYLKRLTRDATDKLRVTDKMPQNFLHLGLITLLFPKSYVIHCTRDPKDTCLSIYFHDFTGHNPYSHDLEHIVHFYKLYNRLMQHWQTCLSTDIHELNYEELLAHPESVSRKLIEYLGLEWEPQCLDFHQTNRIVMTASNWQVRQPLFHTSLQRWRNYEKFIGPLLPDLEDYVF